MNVSRISFTGVERYEGSEVKNENIAKAVKEAGKRGVHVFSITEYTNNSNLNYHTITAVGDIAHHIPASSKLPDELSRNVYIATKQEGIYLNGLATAIKKARLIKPFWGNDDNVKKSSYALNKAYIEACKRFAELAEHVKIYPWVKRQIF